MRDWEALVDGRLAGLVLESAEKAEVIAEEGDADEDARTTAGTTVTEVSSNMRTARVGTMRAIHGLFPTLYVSVCGARL